MEKAKRQENGEGGSSCKQDDSTSKRVGGSKDDYQDQSKDDLQDQSKDDYPDRSKDGDESKDKHCSSKHKKSDTIQTKKTVVEIDCSGPDITVQSVQQQHSK